MSNENTSHTPLFTKKSVPHFSLLLPDKEKRKRSPVSLIFLSASPITVRTSASFPVITASLRNTADSPLTVFSDGTELYVFILRRIISAIIRGKTANYPACNQYRGKYCFLPHKNTFFQS